MIQNKIFQEKNNHLQLTIKRVNYLKNDLLYVFYLIIKI